MTDYARFEESFFDDDGNVLTSPTVEVMLDGDSPSSATIYSDREGLSVLANPFTVEAGNDSFTKALLHFDGPDGATSTSDEGAGGSMPTWEFSADGVIDTGQSKFGGSSASFDGVGDLVSTGDSADYSLGSSDFTIDLQFRASDTGGNQRTLACQVVSNQLANADSAWLIEKTSGNVIAASVVNGTTATTVTGTTQYTTSTNAGWHHCAFVRAGNTLKLLIDGVQQGGDVAFSLAVNDSSQSIRIGAGVAAGWQGHVDEFRLSIGTARWTAGFTVPSIAYSDGATVGFHAAGGAYLIEVTSGLTTRMRRYVGIGTGNERDLTSVPVEPSGDFEVGMIRLTTETVDPGVSLSIEFGNEFVSTYDMYEFRLNGLVPEFTGSPLNLRLSSGSSPGFNDGAADYEWQKCEGTPFAITPTADRDDNEIVLLSALPTEGATGWVRIVNPDNASMYALVTWQIATHNSSATFSAKGSGRLRNLAAITGAQFYIATLNVAFDAGSITLYGYRK